MYSKRLVTCRVLMMAAVCGVLMHAQVRDEPMLDAATAATAPYALFQDSTITSSGNSVMATRVPTVSSTGQIVYYDVTLLFAEDASGGLTLASGYPKVVKSANPITSAFVAGSYIGPSTVLNGEAKISVAGPGIAPGGATEWSLNATTGAASCTYPTSATWYVSSSLASSPLAARLKAAGITSTAFSYGTVGSGQCTIDNSWRADSLIGVSQTGNKLTIVNFTLYSTGKDQSQWVDQITYTLSSGS